MIRDGNWDSVTNDVVWSPNIANQSIPASFYLASKPSWWNNWGVTGWPAYGPSPTNPSLMIDCPIPAELRYDQLTGTPAPGCSNFTATSAYEPVPSQTQAPLINGRDFTANQQVTITESPQTWGTGPYTYNFIVENSIISSALFASGPTASNTYSYMTSTPGQFDAVVQVKDSNSDKANSTFSETYIVYGANVATDTAGVPAGYLNYDVSVEGGVPFYTVT